MLDLAIPISLDYSVVENEFQKQLKDKVIEIPGVSKVTLKSLSFIKR